MTMTRPLNREKAEAELQLHIKKATSPEETAPKQKHVRGKTRKQKVLTRRIFASKEKRCNDLYHHPTKGNRL